MAQYFLSVNRGKSGNLGDVLVATSAPTADTYVQILTTANQTKMDVWLALKKISEYMQSNGVPGGQVGTDLPPL